MADKAQASVKTTKRKKKRSVKSWIARVCLSLIAAGVVIVAVLVVFGPAMIGRALPGYVEYKTGSKLAGKVHVDAAALTWRGPQEIGPVVLFDEAGAEVARVDIKATVGLLELLKGNMDLGTMTVSGMADVVVGEDGRTNIERIFGLAGGGSDEGTSGPGIKVRGSGQSSRLPPNLVAKLVLDQFDVRYTDPGLTEDGSITTVGLTGLTGEASVATGKPVELKLAGDAKYGEDQREAGHVDLLVTYDNWSDSTGHLMVDDAVTTVWVEVAGGAVSLVDAISGQAGRLTSILGELADVSVMAEHSRRGVSASVVASSEGVTVNASIAADEDGLRLTEPARVRIGADAMQAEVVRLLRDQDRVSIGELPEIVLLVESFNAPNMKVSPVRAAPGLDLRGASIHAALTTTEATGRLVAADLTGPQGKGWRLAPLELKLDSDDLSGEVAVSGGTDLKLGGKSAGILAVDVRIAGMLDESGGIHAGLPKTVEGSVVLDGVATAIAQPLVKAFGIDLAEDVGPELRLGVNAAAAAGDDGTPVTAIDFAVSSERLTGQGAVELTETSLRSRGEGVGIEFRRAGALASRFVPEAAGVELAPGGWVRAKVGAFNVPLSAEDRKPVREQISARAELAIGAIHGTLTGDGQAVDVRRTDVTVNLMPGSPVRVKFDSRLAYDEVPFSATAQGRVEGLLTEGAIRPLGRVQLTGVPTVLLDSFGGGKIRPVLDEALGSQVTVTLMTSVPQEAEKIAKPGDTELFASLRAGTTMGSLTTIVNKDAVHIRRGRIETTVTPTALATALDTFAPEMESRPRLRKPIKFEVMVEPLSVARTEQGLALTEAGQAGFAIQAIGQMFVDNVAQLPGGPLSVGAQRLSMDVSVPVGAMVEGGSAGKATFALAGVLLDSKGAEVAEINADAGVEMLAAKRSGGLEGHVRARNVNIAWLDEALGEAGRMVGAVGKKALVDLQIDGAKAGEFDVAAAVQSPRIRMGQAAKVHVGADQISLVNPWEFVWKVSPTWASEQAFKAKPGEESLLAFTEPVDLTVALSRFAVGRGEAIMAPGLFALGATVSAPQVAMKIRGEQDMALTDVSASLGASKQQGALGYNIKAGSTEGSTGRVEARGSIRSLADGAGVLTPDDVTINAQISGQKIRTRVIDAIAGQGGLLVELLGETTDLELRAQGLSRAGGRIEAEATSPRAGAKIVGRIEDDVFVSQAPAEFELLEMSPALAAKLFKVAPLVGSMEKKPEDGPAVVTITDLRLPLDGDLRKLHAKVAADPGAARFETSGLFGELLGATGQAQEGFVGRRIDKFDVNIVKGVASYQRFALPLGEFKVETEGMLDLVNKRQDIVTWVPMGVLSDSALDVLNTGLGKILGDLVPTFDELTMVPIRSKGLLGKAAPVPDMALFMETTGKNLLRPDKVIERVLEDLLGGG